MPAGAGGRWSTGALRPSPSAPWPSRAFSVDEQLLRWIADFSYPAVFALLLGSGVGLPVSEDLVLLTAGLVTKEGGANLYLMMAVAWVGVVCADSLLYRLGRVLGPRAVESKRLKKVLTPSRVAWVQGHFDRYG